jgi:hypothetical protein
MAWCLVKHKGNFTFSPYIYIIFPPMSSSAKQHLGMRIFHVTCVLQAPPTSSALQQKMKSRTYEIIPVKLFPVSFYSSSFGKTLPLLN